MIPKQHFVNKLREIGFSFSRRAKRVELYRMDGNTKMVSIPTHKMIAEPAARSILKQCGCEAKEIDAFIESAKRPLPKKG